MITLSSLLEEHPTLTKEFAKEFNKIFKNYNTTILGSLSEVKPNYYDLIMSNPPYLSKGTANIKDIINKNDSLKIYYINNGRGLESLFLEKMVHELKNKGKALIVIPQGILFREDDKELRKFILKECILDGLISLPPDTFYNTSKKTYILALTKKKIILKFKLIMYLLIS